MKEQNVQVLYVTKIPMYIFLISDAIKLDCKTNNMKKIQQYYCHGNVNENKSQLYDENNKHDYSKVDRQILA